MNTDHLKKLAIDATPGPWRFALWTTGNRCAEVMTAHNHRVVRDASVEDSAFIAAANPAAMLEFISQYEELLAALKQITDAADCRDNTMGDACRLITVKADLASAAKNAREVIAKVESQS